MAQQWFVKTRKGPAGPFTAKKIKTLVRQGKLKPSAHIRIDGKQWMKAGTVEGLKRFFANAEAKKAEAKQKKVEQTKSKTDQGPDPNELLMQPDAIQQFLTAPEPTSHLIQQREQAYTKQFGPFESVSHPLAPGSPHIDVYIHPPTDARPFNTLVTGGMSDHPMPVPGDGPASSRCELLLYVHKVEDLHIELLRFLASQPFLQKTWFSYGSTMNNGNPPQPIFDGSVLDHYVFMFPVIGTDFDFHKSVSIDGSPLQLLHVEPITTAERQLIIKKGLEAFLELLEKKQHSPMLNPERKCYVKKRWFGRS